MTDREVFLDYLAEKSGRPRHQLKDHPLVPVNDLPESTMSGLSQDELLEVARRNAPAVHVNFQTCTASELPGALDSFVSAKAQGHLLLPTDDENFAEFGLESWREGLDPKPTYWVPAASRETNITTASQAQAAIGFADFLCAESCTITAPTTPGQGRAFHFLPVNYLSIIRKSKIVPRTRQAMDYYDPAIKSGKLTTSNLNFITGTSSTGDIEMVLVVGVHGPLEMTYLVVTDR
ncbi:L-lactate dehydrogenase complex protein LldG [Bifidobacterium bohemicum]|uniref:YkgG family protein n=1 Tax=Bifidobacterium bohemicum DSM 22767 TaxID=1437606 RepID=A0A086ZDZ0_9BIFI|nr:lactate utilization protein C [Bifidobacterium bohemicum]KFI44740.1 YkgG family protein [Bifidobacterium bohemicum DSM 22767]SCC17666.1 L-lactate dehydrogenase complex protein LldG [Bifidobacterium bohemicum]